MLPEPAAQTLWSTSEGDIVFWVAIAAALFLASRAAGVRNRRFAVAAGLVVAGAFLAILSYDLSAGDGYRYFVPVGLLLRIGILIAIALAADGLIAARKTRRSSETSA